MRKLFLTVALVLAVYTAQAQLETTTAPRSEKEQVATPKVKVFPNPATNVVNVLGVLNSSSANIAISDMYGNVVLTHEWQIRNNALNIPVTNLKAGIYMVSIRSKEQVVQTKFYKQ
ncbi:T9SS type A sorting domain-containing protein [Maribacter sp.]|nr:T9SS type A sorting domain-containing protein [Maribacter sp.]